MPVVDLQVAAEGEYFPFLRVLPVTSLLRAQFDPRRGASLKISNLLPKTPLALHVRGSRLAGWLVHPFAQPEKREMLCYGVGCIAGR